MYKKFLKKVVDISVDALYNNYCVTEIDVTTKYRGVAQLG